jgi:hypothetical protein
MTIINPVEVQCAVCGQTSKQYLLISTNSFGSADLDTRPPEMMRSTIAHWVQRCTQCGYCNDNLSALLPNAPHIMASEAYRDQLINRALPDLANSFLCASIILAALADYARAGWNSLRAAWVCDDTPNIEGAVSCRKRAADLFKEAQLRNQPIATQAGAADALMVDVLRRSRQFPLALSLCEEGLRKYQDDLFKAIFRFQQMLIQRGDTGCYTIAQAVGNA